MQQQPGQRQNTPWKKVVQKQLSRSTMPLIPQMVKRQSKVRRTLNMVVFLGCACGFVYQVYCYSSHFMTFPTNIDIEMKYVKYPEFPIVTICSRNSIRRTEFCHDYPKKCQIRGWNASTRSIVRSCKKEWDCKNITVPFLNVSDDRSFVAKYGHQFLLSNSSCFEIRGAKRRRCRDEDIGRLQYRSVSGEYKNCFRIDLRNKEYRNSSGIFLPVQALIVSFNVEESEYSSPQRLVGAHFCLHSRHDVVDPFVDGFFVKVGKAYRININMKEKVLLPWPYSSNCFDYDKFSEGKSEYYSYASCYYECMLNSSIEKCGHVTSYYPYPNNLTNTTYRKNDRHSKPKCSDTPDLYSECFDKCQQPCRSTEFVIDGLKEDHPDSLLGENIIHSKEFSYLFITFRNNFITTYRYQPKYQTVEFLAMIGGYIGIWLGMSLLTIADFVETVSVILYAVLCKKKKISSDNTE